LFSQSQILKAKKLIKNKDLQLNFLVNKKAYFKVKNYSILIDLRNKKFICDCNYFILRKKYCSHILASLFYLFGEVNTIYQFLKKKK